MAPRKIIHLDLDAFFCAVEEQRRPELHEVPFAVGGQPNERGVVASCSYAARACGVHSAMPTARALQLCPQLVLVPPAHDLYGEVSDQVMTILASITPLLEQISIDEAFLDVSDLPQSVEELAAMIQARINRESGLPCSLGAASNKLVAKIATDTAKARRRGPHYPNAILVVPPGQEAAFLAPLPAQALWGVGPKTAVKLASMGIKTIGQLAKISEKELARQYGKMGLDLSQHARGIDDRPVFDSHTIKSISQEITFDRDISDEDRLRRTLQDLTERVSYRLRQKGLCASTVRLKLRWSDFTTPTRQITLDEATDQDGVLSWAVMLLFDGLWKPGTPVRLLGVGTSGLAERAHQLSLWDTPNEKERRLLDALDQLRERYGKTVVRRGRSLLNKRQ